MDQCASKQLFLWTRQLIPKDDTRVCFYYTLWWPKSSHMESVYIKDSAVISITCALAGFMRSIYGSKDMCCQQLIYLITGEKKVNWDLQTDFLSGHRAKEVPSLCNDSLGMTKLLFSAITAACHYAKRKWCTWSDTFAASHVLYKYSVDSSLIFVLQSFWSYLIPTFKSRHQHASTILWIRSIAYTARIRQYHLAWLSRRICWSHDTRISDIWL